ncbi:MAG: adenylate/guanylate cyclase domain-containing protein [Isosphaeraceae bacterium]
MLQFFVSSKDRSQELDHDSGPFEFGREPRPGTRRCVLDNDPYVSKDHLRVEELPSGAVRVANLSKRVAVPLEDGSHIKVGEARELATPIRLTLGQTAIEIRKGGELPVDATMLCTVTPPIATAGFRRALALDPATDVPDPSQLTRWFETVVSVQRAAASSPEFYQEIARAVVDLIGLDHGLVLLRKGENWEPVAVHSAPGAPRVNYSYSRTVLERVREERRTFYQGGDLENPTESLTGIIAMVASPVLDPEGGAVIGVVFGAKVRREATGPPQLKPLHAQLVQVLAAAAAAGIARISTEAEAARRRVQFEQFFSRELSDELDRNPELLLGQDREVSILVSDIRGFSRIAERLGARETCLLMGDILERLTARIYEHGGVVVDYVGDGILAMWNAPLAQADHAARACRAAQAMLGELPGLNECWGSKVQTTLALGIGVNTGDALVGNTGCLRRLQYGPLGNTVNLASRVEGATKQLGVPLLITGTTRALIGDSFPTRRLCRVRVVGIDAPTDLHELHGGHPTPRPPDLRIAWVDGRWAYVLPELRFGRSLSERTRMRGGKWKWYLS